MKSTGWYKQEVVAEANLLEVEHHQQEQEQEDLDLP
jgi:hypothetical protein